jgi:hypothetical protein
MTLSSICWISVSNFSEHRIACFKNILVARICFFQHIHMLTSAGSLRNWAYIYG